MLAQQCTEGVSRSFQFHMLLKMTNILKIAMLESRSQKDPISLFLLPIPRPRTCCENGWFPHQPLRFDSPPRNPLRLLLRPLLLLPFNHTLRQHNNMLSLTIPQHIQRLQRMQHVIGRHRQQGANLLNRDFSICLSLFAVSIVVVEEVDDGVGPVGAVA